MTHVDVLPYLSFDVRTVPSVALLNMLTEGQALKANEKIILSLAKEYAKKGLPLEDAQQEASLAFVKAFRAWKDGNGDRLSTWAYRHIKHALLDALKKVNTESKYRTDPPPPSGRDDDARYDPADRMNLMRADQDSPEERFAVEEERREGYRLLATLSDADQQFLLQVKELGYDGVVRKLEHMEPTDKVPSNKRMQVIRRTKKLEAQLAKAAKKWSA